jgi:flagellar hook-associated protein 3 FlgL
MRVSDRQMFLQSIAAIIGQRAEVSRFQNQLSTGRKLLSPADDPAASAQVLGLRQAIQATEQYQVNANLANGRLGQEESFLIAATDSIQRIRELVIQGKNGSLSDADRRIVANEIETQLEQLLAVGNARDANGEYLFSGFQGKTRPFTRSPAGPVVYNGDQGQRLLQISADHQVPDRDSGHDVFMAIRQGNGTFATSLNTANTGTGLISDGTVLDPSTFQANDFRIVFTSATTFDVIDDTTATTILAAQPYTDGAAVSFNGVQVEIFGQPATGDEFNVNPSGYQSVFTTVDNVITALRAIQNTPTQQAFFNQKTDQALIDLDQALENILEVRTAVGGRLKAIDSQRNVNEDFVLRLTEVRSSLEDADIAEASIQLNQASVALQAAQQAYVITRQLSLFNFL